MADVTIHHQNSDALKLRAGQVWADRVGPAVGAAARRRVNVDLRILQGSITYEQDVSTRAAVVIVGAHAKYARWVHDGTGIYGPTGRRIYPRRAPYLRFRPGKRSAAGWSNQPFVRVRSIRGMKGNPYLADALEDVFGPIVVRNHHISR